MLLLTTHSKVITRISADKTLFLMSILIQERIYHSILPLYLPLTLVPHARVDAAVVPDEPPHAILKTVFPIAFV